MLLPHKYYKGLTRKKALERKKEISTFSKLHWKNSKAYVGFKTDKKTNKKSHKKHSTQKQKEVTIKIAKILERMRFS
jgi:hypothetical protein